ncbi:MAG: arginase family protein, partial [Candidatus Geothermarchaeales archaeon]
MKHPEIPTFSTGKFANSELPLERAEFGLFGSPFDGRSTGRRGALRAPDVFRYFSSELETTSLRFKVDYRMLRICDLGDVVGMDFATVFEQTKSVVGIAADQERVPVMLGGEHTMTWAAVEAIHPELLVIFDAHLDMRDSYLGQSASHTTFLRRIAEASPDIEILHLGFRAAEVEEILYAKDRNVTILPSSKLVSDGPARSAIGGTTRGREGVYVSVDLDVMDPAYMEAVSNPEPGGISPDTLFSLFDSLVESDVIGFDIMELSPTAEWSPSYHLAAKTVLELMSAVSKDTKTKLDET